MGKSLGPVAGAALDIGQGVVETGLGMALAGWQDKRQIKQARKLQELEIAGSKQLTDYSYAKQLQMWKDTNYSAQAAELAKAGLNPGLLYGMGGAGGQSTGGGAEKTQGQAAAATQALGMEIGIQAAQRQLLQAQTENVKADTANKTQDTRGKGIANQIAEETLESAIQLIRNERAISEERMDQEKFKTQEEEVRWLQRQERADAELAEMLLKNNEIRAKIGLTQAQYAQIAAQIGKITAEIKNMGDKLTLEQQKFEFEQKMRDIKDSQKFGKEVIESIFKALIPR